MAGCPVSPGSLAPGSPSMLLGPDMSASAAPPITRSLDDVRAQIASGAIRHALVITALARVLDLRRG